jgi:hypothetical protein
MNITMAMGIAVLETIYSEFTTPLIGFRTAFSAAGAFCLAAALMLIFFAGEKRGRLRLVPEKAGRGRS